MNDALELIESLIVAQKEKVFTCARRIVPHITQEDVLQPNDFPQLEFHPHFRFEEGILDGMQVVRAAIQASLAEISIG
jgi:hypothetical protein